MTFVLTTAEEITNSIDAIIAGVYPSAGRRPVYGGIRAMIEQASSKHMSN